MSSTPRTTVEIGSDGRITGSTQLMLVNASGMWEMAQSELKQKCGIEFQVYPDDCNVNVYFCVRVDESTGRKDSSVTRMIGDVDVQICVLDLDTGLNQVCRAARLAKPSGDSFRDFMVTFNRVTVASMTRKSDNSVSFKAQFSVRVVDILIADPADTIHDADDCTHADPADCPFSSDRTIRVTGIDAYNMDHDVVVHASRSGRKDHQLHKSVLKVRSPYFKRLLSKPLHQNLKYIEMEVTVESLCTFLRYSYTADIVFEMKQLPDLIRDATQFEYFDILFAIGKTMTVKNVYLVKKLAADAEEQSLVDMCDQFIEANINHFFKRENFIVQSSDTIRDLLTLEKLPIREKQVWDLVMQWLEHQTIGWNGGPLTLTEKRKILHPIICQIRFAAMSLKDFTSGPLESGILTPVQVRDVMRNLVHGKRCQIFYDTPRFQRNSRPTASRRSAATHSTPKPRPKSQRNESSQSQSSLKSASQLKSQLTPVRSSPRLKSSGKSVRKSARKSASKSVSKSSGRK